MRFEEAYDGWTSRRLTQEEAARLSGVCERSFRRYIDRYHGEGLEASNRHRCFSFSTDRHPQETCPILDSLQFTLEAAYSSYAQVTSLSLFDRL